MMRATNLAAVVLFSMISSSAWADPPFEIEPIDVHLARFRDHTREVMNEDPQRWDPRNPVVNPVRSSRSLRERNRLREQIMGTRPLLSHLQGNDLPEAFVDDGIVIRTPEALESAGWTKARLATSPWSGDTWGFSKGIIAARYADPGFPANLEGDAGKLWADNYEYVRANPASAIFLSGAPERIDNLSPSEKYELLVGDQSFSLTQYQWNLTRQYVRPDGSTGSWFGICEGWSQASFGLPRPAKAVTLTAADGKTPIRFYPSDIKALASLLWSKGSFPRRFIGGRCEQANPSQDINGRIVTQECFDTNPGTFHLSITNQIGRARRGFVFDASSDVEVWNNPVLGYEYRYFNPQTGRAVGTLEEARVSRERFTVDKFRPYRSRDAASYVGIVLDMTYVTDAWPDHSLADSEKDDQLRTIRYYYDLELDSSGRIVGGEWYNNHHPDFMWAHSPGAHALSVAEDQAFEAWDGDSPVPGSWRNAAYVAASYGQPLGKLVEKLIELAR